MSESSSRPAPEGGSPGAVDLGAADVEVVADELVYDGFYKVRKLQLRHRQFAGGWGPLLQRELVLRHEAVGVLLYDPVLDAVGLVEQFRIGAVGRGESPWLLEIVAGLIDADETPEAVGRREATEEADCQVGDLVPIARYFSSPGGNNEYFHLYCGRCDLASAGGIHGLAEEGEDIRVHVLPAAAAFALLSDGERPLNAHLLIALLWLQQQRDSLRARWR